MGSLSAQAMAEFNGLNEQTMSWHLQHNMFPSQPLELVPTALAAIDAINEEDVNREIDLPEGMSFRDGRETLPAWEIADSLRLWHFASSEVEL